jgi:Bacterial Ig domain
MCLVALLCLASALAQAAPAPETHRVRVINRVGGPVEVSLDRGRSYTVVGHVVRPATANTDGLPFVGAVRPGTVALVGASRLLIRTNAGHGRPRVFALQAAERNGSSPAPRSPDWVIATDVPEGSSVFEALAPPLGSQLFLQSRSGLQRLPEGYVPTPGDTLVFLAEVPASLPVALVFENRPGGRVIALGGDGHEETLGSVRRPLSGVGRYPGTARITPGRLAEHHAGALLISTAGPSPRRPVSSEPGGFRIEIAREAREASGTVMQVEPADAARGALFAWPIPMDAATRVEMRVDGSPWMPLPRVRGLAPDAFGAGLAGLGGAGLGEVTTGVTHLRLLFGGDPALRRAALAQASRLVAMRARGAAPPTITERPPSRPGALAGRPLTRPVPSASSGPYHGKLTITANVTGQGIAYVIFLLDGKVAKITNAPPYTWDWDTRHAPNGDHTVEIRGADEEGNIINQRVSRVRVKN